AVAAIGTLAGNAELRWSDLRIEAMDCPTEGVADQAFLGRQPAVESLEFNLMQRLLRVQHRFDAQVAPAQLGVAGQGSDGGHRRARRVAVPMIMSLTFAASVGVFVAHGNNSRLT
ncbi:hypothetical protein ACV33P_31670, partial [Pseudomonas aeruginosa]